MTSDLLSVEARDGVEIWRLSFPPVNGIGPTLLDALNAQTARAAEDESLAAVVVASDLKIFSAGADAKWMAQYASEHGPDSLLDEFIRTMSGFRALLIALHGAPFLTIAAIGGHALAGGLELAAGCDLRFASDDETIKLGVPEMELFGNLPDGGGGVQFLNRVLSPSRALLLVLDAGPVSPRRALELGLVDRLCAAEALLDEATAFAEKVARTAGRRGVSAAKRTVFGGAELPFGEAMAFDEAVHWDAVRRSNFVETTTAFTKRFA